MARDPDGNGEDAVLDNRVFLKADKTQWGWHMYYDPTDGKPFLMSQGERRPPDDPR